MVGPSNIITLLNSIPPYWEPMRRLFHLRVGDPEDPSDRERLIAQSPLFSAENIRAPLLVYQGANDPRVVKHESDQIVVAMRDLGLPVEYLVAWDEGHSMAVRENRLAIMASVEEFLAQHLGGRYQQEAAPDIRTRLTDLRVDVDTLRLPPAGAAGTGGRR
jgi:dipeptidyl aminopeptidase/acylaminoacyl peptidase